MVALPGDVLLMILDILKTEGHNHNTLYQCALASRWLAEPALSILYQIYDTSPVAGGGFEDDQLKTKKSASPLGSGASKNAHNSIVQKWALMWRSLILSTWQEKTYLPYCKYIRYLNLDDLRELMSDLGMKKTRDEFIAGDLDKLIYRDGRAGFRTSTGSLNYSAVVERVGTFSARFLKTWAARLPHLETLDVWHGASLGRNSQEDIREHFPNLKNISVFRWTNENGSSADSEAESVLKSLRPDSLQSFNVMSLSDLGPRSIIALGYHLKSLTALTLTSLSIEAIEQLPSLGALESLEDFVLTDSRQVPQNPPPELISSVAGWICKCEKLRFLRLRRFLDDANLLSQILVDKRIHLELLHLKGYMMETSRAFHESLAFQPSLQVLSIQGDGSQNPTDQAVLVKALSKLGELRELDLKVISEFFTEQQIMALIPALPKLERFSFSGLHCDDNIWPAFLSLKNLRFLAIHASSEFTSDGILDFVSQLGPENEGFHLSIPNALIEIPPDSQDVIRDALAQNVKGTLDYDVLPGTKNAKL
ncbi:hypothetical protein BGW36DRAFT_304777 [Talaromyces proteolyticus]|uniref:Uncharacterized protein n=1 Tax=Talaromyces proteolyticus TaxID=1131652 RepID=A0AAD4KM49_9EURO|nr:uncharacterized protein BGW36DRAFT_304777 [Talaromyces proteolyticus]KAH8691290.1 hypothetical protein BGW36DRAFT_304777 [Talaromyces proteolyticus]